MLWDIVGLVANHASTTPKASSVDARGYPLGLRKRRSF